MTSGKLGFSPLAQFKLGDSAVSSGACTYTYNVTAGATYAPTAAYTYAPTTGSTYDPCAND